MELMSRTSCALRQASCKYHACSVVGCPMRVRVWPRSAATILPGCPSVCIPSRVEQVKFALSPAVPLA
eukprot:3789306-Lingulodinium_polyedra.AAC.1